MITFACPHCGLSIKTKDALAGRTGKCARCGRRIKVPADLPPSVATPVLPKAMPVPVAKPMRVKPAKIAARQIKHFFSKVVGVTKTNPDGKRRQAIVQGCPRGERLVLDTEPDNPVDTNAVKVCRSDGQQLGYLNGRLASDVGRRSKQGYLYAVFVSEITGGGEGESFGCNLVIIESSPGISNSDAQQYVDRYVQPLFD